MSTHDPHAPPTTRYVAFDFESYLIEPGILAPKPVCMSFAEGGEVDLVATDDGWERLYGWLEDADVILVGANVAYDLGLAVTWAPEPDRMMRLVFAAYDNERIRDVQVRDKLFMLAQGRLSFDAITNKMPSFSLGALSERYLNTPMDKGGDTWRLRYSELDGVPIHKYPQDAMAYALTDAITTLDVFLAQGTETLVDELPQTDAAWALHLISMSGLEVDLDGVAKLEAELQASVADVHAKMRQAGILRANGSKDMKVLKARVERAYAALGVPLPVTEKGATSTAGDTLLASGDDLLVAIGEAASAEKLLSAFIPMLKQGIVNPNYDVLKETGRTSSFNPNIQQMPRKGGIRELYRPPEGYAFVDSDYSTVELVALAQVCLDLFGHSAMAEAINEGKDLHLVTAAQIMGIPYEEALKQAKAKDPEVKEKRQLAKCFHPDTEVLTPEGWVRIAGLRPGQQVLAAQPAAGGQVAVVWETPMNLTRRHADSLVHLKNKGIDLRVTPDHRMVGYSLTSKGLGRRRKVGDIVDLGEPRVVAPLDLPKVRQFPSAGILDNERDGWSPDERILRLAVATQADGSVANGRIRFGFSKQRKIERLRSLLDSEEYVESVTSQGARAFQLQRDISEKVLALLDADKTIPWKWLDLAPARRTAALDEVTHWDSYTGAHRSDGRKAGAGVVQATLYSSTQEKNADVWQALAVISGRKTRKTHKVREHANHLDVYELSIKKGHLTRGDSVSVEPVAYDGEVVCLSVPSTFVVVRDGGTPVVVGQCLNFGFPGGMGPDAFVEFALGYGLVLDRDFVAELKKVWFDAYPEMKDYFSYISQLAGTGETFDLTQLRSGRVRGGCRYTAACNSLFQGLAADGAKRALRAIVRECFLPPLPGETPSPLYGCLVHAFVHDEVLLSAPIARVHEAAVRLEEIMVECMRYYMPDVDVRVETEASDRWSKSAERVVDENGRLQVWTPEPG